MFCQFSGCDSVRDISNVPVILDDIFGMYEEENLEAVLGWMYKEKKQVIISTCSKREMELLDRDGIPYGKQIIS